MTHPSTSQKYPSGGGMTSHAHPTTNYDFQCLSAITPTNNLQKTSQESELAQLIDEGARSNLPGALALHSLPLAPTQHLP
jgi:hypothetical protein